MKRFLIALLLTIYPLSCYAQAPKNHYYYEKDYQKAWCAKQYGTTEVILNDRARVDCVTDTHAVEFDFASKWAESIGQALYYGAVLNKTPGIVLIVEDKIKDQRYVDRVKVVANQKGLSLWLMYPEDVK